METKIREDFDKAIFNYSKDNFKKDYLKAKDEFFGITGSIHQDHEDFEQRMNSFYEWYFFSFNESKVLKNYTEVNPLFKDFKYSIYEYNGKNFRGRAAFKDFISKEKLIFPKNILPLGITKGDIIVGRFINLEDGHYLLPGFFILPGKVRSILKRESRRIAKINDDDKKEEFLLKIETLYNRWRRYNHLDPAKIFVYGP
ncbi:MAG: hypothetical protein DRQ88_12475 [Epsilonproteobacteria bacterium]|nr:MAG: hypothetical protein DRQ89_09360 [Campylobacterota bacterium]RLA63383.1 MAG: hypothetical protein DRQ88_12475 [Campylobacterota bacterium]